MTSLATQSNEPTANLSRLAGLVAFDKWLEERGTTRCTGWRYRKAGLIETVNIFGRVYVSRDEIARFEARAMAGEFTKAHANPSRQKADA